MARHKYIQIYVYENSSKGKTAFGLLLYFILFFLFLGRKCKAAGVVFFSPVASFRGVPQMLFPSDNTFTRLTADVCRCVCDGEATTTAAYYVSGI